MVEFDNDDEHSKGIRGREAYDSYQNEIDVKRMKLANPGTGSVETVEQLFVDLDTLYELHASNTSNTFIIDADQRAFRNTVDVISERMKKQAHELPNEITMESMADALKYQAEIRSSGRRALENIGSLFNRGSKVASLPLTLPMLADVNRSERRIIRPNITRAPTGERVQASAGDESEFKTEKIQRKTQGLIMSTVVNDELVNDYEPLLLYRLCFDKFSFVRTLENFFAVSILVKEQKLWLGANKRGLPVIGSVQNREKYLGEHTQNGSVAGPSPDIDLRDPTQADKFTRQQFNINLNYELYEAMQRVFKDEDPLLPRTDYDSPGDE